MTQMTREQQIAALEKDWATNPRWKAGQARLQRRRRGASARQHAH
jgi:hypothetical protein